MNTSEIQIWRQTQDRLKSFVFRHTKDKAVTDDIIQDVFLKVHARLGQLKESEKMAGWIFQITRNTITDYFRSKGKVLRAEDIDWENEEKPLNECVSKCLEEMIVTLPEKYRQPLELAELREVPQFEIARLLNLSYSGAKSRVQRARQMLREKMQAAYDIRFDAYGNVMVCEGKLQCSC
jgi:RNA polymerase sigma-70 factor (ECF subfamily)